MKAQVQYNDFIGTAAADESDHIKLKAFLEKKGVDVERYEPIGAKFYMGGRNFYGHILCKDHHEERENFAVKISFENGLSCDEFFSLFKRFEVIITLKHGGYQDWELQNDSIHIDDRE